jgi:putative ABC transport system permease protein
MMTYEGKKHEINDLFWVSGNFLQVFDIPLLKGNKDDVLKRKNQAIISESLARQLFGSFEVDDFQPSPIYFNSWNIWDTVFVSGIFKDIPETSHFQSDIFIFLPDDYEFFFYTYLLLKENTDIKTVEQKITTLIGNDEAYKDAKIGAILMPLADIHLRSHNLREMSVNGNINYIYLIAGANALLLIVVMFNLWLNVSLVFARNRRYYQLLRLHGAAAAEVFKDGALAAALLGVFSMIAGILTAFYILSLGKMSAHISFFELGVLCPLFLLMIIAVSLLPALKGIAYTLFLNTDNDLRPVRFSYSNVKYMLVIQYAVVMMVFILAFGIYKQMNLVKDTQVGGNERTILVLKGQQPDPVKAKYSILKSELLKYPEIESVTSSFQLPGEAIIDGLRVKENDSADWKWMPVIIAGEDFLPFFRIPLIVGRDFSPLKFDYRTEETMLWEHARSKKSSDHVEEYIINRKALALLGFNTPEDAVGQTLQIQHGFVDYFRSGIIVGVTDDFNYTGLFEETEPLLLLQRNFFQHRIMVRLNPNRFVQAQAVFEKVWNEVFPDYPAGYLFMDNVFRQKYHNEMNAQQLVLIFSLLCLIIADLGLLVFMSFIVRRRRKEIGIRKVCGASVGDIIRMLNMNFIRYIALAFAAAVPVAWYIMHRWLERFAYKTSLDWWLFLLAGLMVLSVSVASVSLQSWRAARANPVEAKQLNN